jgi:hypothetical protein
VGSLVFVVAIFYYLLKRAPLLGAARPAAGAAPQVLVAARVDGRGGLLRQRRWWRQRLLPHPPRQLRHRHPDRGDRPAAGVPGGEKATLLWDGLACHRSRAMRAFLATQRDWLVVERLPAYAPELNPAEGLWSNLKGNELANVAADGLGGVMRVRATWWLPYSFLRHAGLSVS